MGETQHELTDAGEQLKVLQQFERARQHLRLRANGKEEDFSTIILLCDWPRRELLLDQAVSPAGDLIWDQQTTVDLDGSVAGVHYLLLNLTPQASQDSEGIGHRVSFPATIIYQQRRQAFRCPVPRAFPSQLAISISQQKVQLSGRLLDLSATGLACECDLPAHTDNSFRINKLVGAQVSVDIALTDLLAVISIAEVKEILPGSQHDKVRLGLEFIDLSPSVQRNIDKAVADLQRLTRKNQTR